MQIVSFFVSAMIVLEMAVLFIIYANSFLSKYTFLNLISFTESLNRTPGKIRIAVSRKSFIEGISLLLIATLFIKAVIMLIPWRI